MRLHHVNIVTSNMPALEEFYQNVLGIPKMAALPLIEIPGYSTVTSGQVINPATFLNASGTNDTDQQQLHLCQRDPYLGARLGHSVNPVASGHLAFRCDDIEQVKRHLDEIGVPYADYGVWAVKGWYQIFVFDPVGNVVEIHQVV